jgi:D-arabinose 1-dehydrogenase-like Zn-dependent alcohol dehydrogenase
MADVVINSLGSQFWDKSFSVVCLKGRIATFSTLLGAEVKVNSSQLYSKHISILGVNRGNRKDFVELLDLCRDCKVKTWKVYDLENGIEALKELFDEKKDGRIFISMH